MCLIVFGLDSHPRYRFVLAANRDEYFRRPTTPAGFWVDAPQVFAGRDLEAGGTWLGVTISGRLAAVTNYREPKPASSGQFSRGRLVAHYLIGEMTSEEFGRTLQGEAGQYGGFNLLFGDTGNLFHCSNRSEGVRKIEPGIHGISNHLLDTPWPKVVRAKQQLGLLLSGEDPDPEEIFAFLAESDPFPDTMLPETGVGIGRERLLSPLFITGSDYGTRSSSIILADRSNRIFFIERSYDCQQRISRTITVTIDPAGLRLREK